MKIIARNFSSENHRVEIQTGDCLVTAIIYKPYFVGEKKFWDITKTVIRSYKDHNYREKLKEILQEVEQHLEINLIKSDLKVA